MEPMILNAMRLFDIFPASSLKIYHPPPSGSIKFVEETGAF